jgi:hypothetical protein
MVERDHYFQSSADYVWVVCRLKRTFFKSMGLLDLVVLNFFFKFS